MFGFEVAFEMMFATKRGDEAVDDAVRWIKGWRASRALECAWSMISFFALIFLSGS